MAGNSHGPHTTEHFIVGRTVLDRPVERAAVQNRLDAHEIPGSGGMHTGPMTPNGNSVQKLADATQVFGEYLIANNQDLLGVVVIPLWVFRGAEHRQMPVIARKNQPPLELMTRLMEALSAQLHNVSGTFQSSVQTLKFDHDRSATQTPPSQEGHEQLQPRPADPGAGSP